MEGATATPPVPSWSQRIQTAWRQCLTREGMMKRTLLLILVVLVLLSVYAMLRPQGGPLSCQEEESSGFASNSPLDDENDEAVAATNGSAALKLLLYRTLWGTTAAVGSSDNSTTMANATLDEIGDAVRSRDGGGGDAAKAIARRNKSFFKDWKQGRLCDAAIKVTSFRWPSRIISINSNYYCVYPVSLS